ncbi:MAG: heme-binding domain-containing protein, partial [Ignavibacteriaceae bacterium]
EGRKRLNFSEWDKYDEKKREKKLDGIIEVVEEGEMPLSMYTIIHKEAILDTVQINILKEWVKPGSTTDEYLINGINRDKD